MKEAKTVLRTKVIIDGVEQDVLVMPITRLDCIEDSADIMETATDGDYIPVMDSADGGQMKKISVEKLIPTSFLANGGNADTVGGAAVMTTAALGLHRMASGTAAATTSNCPVGCWYGQYE